MQGVESGPVEAGSGPSRYSPTDSLVWGGDAGCASSELFSSQFLLAGDTTGNNAGKASVEELFISYMTL